jgi:hypothetical protein
MPIPGYTLATVDRFVGKDLGLSASVAMEIGMVPDVVSQALNYGIDKARFLAPVRSGHDLLSLMLPDPSRARPGTTPNPGRDDDA